MSQTQIATPSDAQVEGLLAELTDLQRQAVTHEAGPLLILAGAGTGKTTVITRRIGWLIATGRAKPEEILALTFTDKAAAEMEERVDLLLPYGYTAVTISTFHAFGDRFLREHALEAGLGAEFRLLSKQEQLVFLREHLFDLPLRRFRPLPDPARYVAALTTLFARAKDEAVSPAEFLAHARARVARAESEPQDEGLRADVERVAELAETYAAYQLLLQEADAVDFGDQILRVAQLLQQRTDIRDLTRRRYRHILVDEFQDTNYAQFLLLQLLAAPTANITVVADDDQSIYKWRGAAISNVLKFLGHYHRVRRVVLVQNFRSSQAVLDAAYRLIRFNDPDRLEVKEGIDKRLVAMIDRPAIEPTMAMFDSGSSEADWVARQIQSQVEAGTRRPGDFAILVRTNREADLFLRALNVAGIPWSFTGTSGLFAREEGKLLLSCLKTLADPEDSLSAFHVISSTLYECPMEDLMRCLAAARHRHQSLRTVLREAIALEGESRRPGDAAVDEPGRGVIVQFLADVDRLTELSRNQSPGQLLYRWLTDTGWLKRYGGLDRADDVGRLAVVARFFDQLRRFEEMVGNRLPDLMHAWEFFQALAEAAPEKEPLSSDAVSILTIHKAKGLEFPVVFMVGLVQGRFPTTSRRDPIELPEGLIKDILPVGDYHLQEERRLFYVGMTRAKEQLYLTAAYDYGGRSVRKLSQFVLEALKVRTPKPEPLTVALKDRVQPPHHVATPPALALPEPLRLDPHGLDDYLTCPLKFRYSHVLRVPIMRHHLVIYGSALHKAVEAFFRRVLQGRPMSEAELLRAFDEAWSSEGFFSREHEQQRLERGREVLRRFYADQQQRPERPALIEEKFSVPVDDFMVVGRWDRVDRVGEDAVIIDYKSSEISDPEAADRRARESLQMAVYAFAWHALHGRLPEHVELRFLETGMIGSAAYLESDLARIAARLREAAQGIRSRDFHAKPDEFACRWCAYQAICPFAAV